jgi:hypothetical protein
VGLGFFRDDNPFIVPPVICDIHKNGKHAWDLAEKKLKLKSHYAKDSKMLNALYIDQ